VCLEGKGSARVAVFDSVVYACACACVCACMCVCVCRYPARCARNTCVYVSGLCVQVRGQYVYIRGEELDVQHRALVTYVYMCVCVCKCGVNMCILEVRK